MSNSIGKRRRKRDVQLHRDRHFARMRRKGDAYSKTGWWHLFFLCRFMGWKSLAAWMWREKKVLARVFRHGEDVGVVHVGGSTLKVQVTLKKNADR